MSAIYYDIKHLPYIFRISLWFGLKNEKYSIKYNIKALLLSKTKFSSTVTHNNGFSVYGGLTLKFI